MKLAALINAHNWLSVEMTLLNLYPDQNEIAEEYKSIYESLKIMEPVNDDILIVLTEYDSDSEEEPNSTYVDVSGRKLKPDPNSNTISYALEFVKWENWLGMDLAPETISNFNELEIIAHCLYEMTFCGYEQDEIQEQLNSINNTIDEFKNLTEEEKKQQTISLEQFLKKLDDNGSS